MSVILVTVGLVFGAYLYQPMWAIYLCEFT